MSRAASAAGEPHVPSARGPAWARWVGWFLAHVVWDTRVTGAERVPRGGPVVLAANHLTLIDGPLLVGVAPRGLHVLVKSELFHGVVGGFLRAAGQIPVDRTMARPALQAALGVLRRGGAVGIFPEGTRGRGTAEQVRAGAAWLAVNGGALVVPVAILGTRRTGESPHGLPGLRRRVVVEFGEPIDVACTGVSRREAIDRAAESIRAAMGDLVATAQERTGVRLPADDPRATV
ncbi:lysophospholipid acyltransferase family protein [Cellulomonas wangsupingiae]|uniref:1-acyl-sn-glycerol-3-phosphate acyltransferase n=1 Tax=Cellulomonas wangsupingiae TaxID=2968085 RepID=A0ABY5K142_9CELL|nr:lysophospholipid acyltransferase family protein [Cellulomonas wangsupingiae]MCC2333310.1 1-acyl-sn-glycerol-3-phosphate acyltransferase [Cellulomonas wangsupingiae]UUI63513.1 1-acyl-sn-glycerol-3-phosphate acyltransferase [Cellulomonas wangsupingiae]